MSTNLEPITIISRYVEQEYRVESTMYRTGRDPEVYLRQEMYLREDVDAKIADMEARLAQKDRDYANLKGEVESSNSCLKKVFYMTTDETASLRKKMQESEQKAIDFEQKLKELQDIHDEYVRVTDAANKELAEDYDKLKKKYDALKERFDSACLEDR